MNTADFPTAADASRNMQFAPPGFTVILGRNGLAVQGLEAAIAKAAGPPLAAC